MSDTQQLDRPILVELQDDNRPRQQWILEIDDITVGRGDESYIAIPRRQISREHIRIYKENDGFVIEDLESKNGTWINGHQLKGKQSLRDGDEIHLALTARLQFFGSGATAPLPFEPPEKIGGRLRLDRDSRRVFIEDTELDPPLSPPQYRLLELLYINSGSVCSREAVVETVWPDAENGDGVSEQAIDALVRRLRDRLAELDPEQQYIVTMRGHGFRMVNPN
ncbi:MAG: FHA domain-containing protein [Chloroflexota bacterium]